MIFLKNRPYSKSTTQLLSGLFFLLSFILISKKGIASKEDSLLNLLKNTKVDTVKFDLTARIYAIQIRKGNFDKAKKYIDSLSKLSIKIDKPKYHSSFYQYKANYFFKTNQFDSAIVFNHKSIEIAVKINYYLALVKCYVSLGNLYNQKADLARSVVSLQKAEQYAILSNDTVGRITTIVNLGNVYYQINDYKQAKSNFKKVIKLTISSPKYKQELASGYNNLATVYLNQNHKELDSSMFYYTKFLELSTELEVVSNIALAQYNIAEVFRLKGEPKKAIEYYIKSQKIYREEGDTVGIMKVCLGLADNYILENKNTEALQILNEGIKYSEQYDLFSYTSDFLRSMSLAHYNLGNYKESIDLFKKGTFLSDSLYNAENSKILYDMQTKYETNEKEKQNKLLEAENTISAKTIKQQQLTAYFIIGGLVLTLLLAFFIFRGLRIQKKANTIISKQKEEVMQQKHIVEEHQKEILDSIHYAKRIQQTILAHKEFIDEYIPNNFIYFNPKDIVSGDFYWATKKEDFFYFAICDSTGHGVPGAFMSLLNIGFLSEAINEKNITEPAGVFNYVRERLVSSVSKDGQKDGFDGILLRINLITKEIIYTAANNSPVIISNGVIKHLKADKMPVGYGEIKEDFSQHKIEISVSDILYLYTDGYADQFGGPKGKKFKYKQLDELLLSLANKSLNEQCDSLAERFVNWKGDLEQIDDVCIIGIKI